VQVVDLHSLTLGVDAAMDNVVNIIHRDFVLFVVLFHLDVQVYVLSYSFLLQFRSSAY